MYYNEFKGEKLSALGFGAMRLPLVPGGGAADIDQKQVDEMMDYAISHGVNYIDTAFPYHGGQSELAVGRALAKYPRESYYLASKYPGHQVASEYNPAEVFEMQLKKCGVEYFDFYLLHNVNELSISVYNDEKWGIVDYFVEQKKLGRIRHLGFSTHGFTETIEAFLDRYGDILEFCQIQLNYLDWTLQDAKAKVELLNRRGVGIWVMEPVRGGKLAKLDEDEEAAMKALRPEESIPAWCFRWLQGVEGVTMILSGMSNMEQMKDNIATFEDKKPLNDEEKKLVAAVAERRKNCVPCTGCRYCCDGCPMQLNIPNLISLYNDANYQLSFNISARVDALGAEGRPSNCIGCGACAAICPQNIDIPALMPLMEEKFNALPSWTKVSKEREEEFKRMKADMK